MMQVLYFVKLHLDVDIGEDGIEWVEYQIWHDEK
jgi:hypothetical protein